MLVDSAQGARFWLALPLPPGVSAPPQERTQTPSALVVDSDDAVRTLLSKLLERRGFEVREAEGVEAALALAEAHPPAVVICDAALAAADGRDLYARLSSSDAPMHFVLMADKTAAAAVPPRRGVRVLEKPFTASDLDATLANAGVAAPRAG
jgi:DNA-binding NtrC family response regulator